MSLTRRSFIKAINAAGIFAMLPAIEIRQGVSMELVQRFCCPHGGFRWEMGDPFVENGNATATDSRAAIRVFDSMGLADTDKPLKIPPAEKAFNELWKPEASFSALPKFEIASEPNLSLCYHCNGNGFLGRLEECEHCCGTGEEIGDDPYEWTGMQCQHCFEGFRSDQRCKHCKGRPEQGVGGVVHLTDELMVNASYFHLVSQLPDARWSFGGGYDASSVHGKCGPVMLVEFQGGQSMVMGVRK